jgi:Ala-tRNA(Pro) deacylase
MSTLENCLNYLKSQRVRFAHTTHSAAYTAEEVALAEHMPANRMAKTVLVRDNAGYVIAVIPADCYVDLEQLRMVIGVPDLYLAEERDLAHLFPNAELGAMPALGNLCNLPVYLDRRVANREFIAFNAGTHRDAIHMRVADFVELVRPVFGDFSEVMETILVEHGHLA